MKTTVISFLNQKGGTGKTTLATNVAHGLSLLGRKVLLVDADPQGSTRDWNAINGATIVPVVGLDRETLAKDIQAVKSGYDVVIIDGAGRSAKLSTAAVIASNVVLIPVQPSPYDIWATNELVDLVKARQQLNFDSPKAAFVISRAIKNTHLARDVEACLEEYALPVLKSMTTQRVIYAESVHEGETVYSSSPNEACVEINNLVSEITEKYLND